MSGCFPTEGFIKMPVCIHGISIDLMCEKCVSIESINLRDILIIVNELSEKVNSIEKRQRELEDTFRKIVRLKSLVEELIKRF